MHIAFLVIKFVLIFFFSYLKLNTCLLSDRQTDTALWISITPTQCPSWRRFQTLWIWLSLEMCKRRPSRPPTGGAFEQMNREIEVDSHIFLHRGDLICWYLSGLFIVEIFIALIQRGETTEGSGSECDCSKSLQVRVLKRPTLWYIYFYTKEAEDMTCSEANNYCGLCSNHLFLHLFLFLSFGFVSVAPLLFSNLPFFLIFFFFLKMLKPFSSLPYDAIWRTMLRAFYVETKVDQGGVWFSERVFISLLFLLLQNPRPRRKAYPPLLPLTL